MALESPTESGICRHNARSEATTRARRCRHATTMPVNHSATGKDTSHPATHTMPKKTLKSLMPSAARIREINSLHFLGDWIYETNLWHINRYSASMAFFVGLFVRIHAHTRADGAGRGAGDAAALQPADCPCAWYGLPTR